MGIDKAFGPQAVSFLSATLPEGHLKGCGAEVKANAGIFLQVPLGGNERFFEINHKGRAGPCWSREDAHQSCDKAAGHPGFLYLEVSKLLGFDDPLTSQ